MSLPYPYYGILYDTDGTTVLPSATVRARNETTNERLDVTTNASGEFSINFANFTSGYLQSDYVTVYVYYETAGAENTVLVSDGTHNEDLTLVSVEDSGVIHYCTVQDVWDELDGVTSADISAHRVVKVIQRAEARIDERTGTKFVSTAFTNEIYDWEQYTAFNSPSNYNSGGYARSDSMGYTANKIQLHHRPILTITTLEHNTASVTAADSWTALTEQTGSGGDFTAELDTGYLTFVGTKPRYGDRAMRVTGTYGYDTTPKCVEDLTIKLTVQSILSAKGSNSLFTSFDSISLEGISISKSTGSSVTYLKDLKEDIESLWQDVGEFKQDVA